MDDNTDRPLIQAVITPKLNLAYYQNAVPLLRELVISNDRETSMRAVELNLLSEPAFIKAKTWRIDVIEAGHSCRITDLDVILDGGLLGRLTEAESARTTFILKVGEDVVSRLDMAIELLARNQWGGIEHMPEMIAAFVQPNEPAVERILKISAALLRKHNRSGALNGYEGGPKRVWELSSAIWAAVGSIGLDYALPPASFELSGQKIRVPAQIEDTRIATCMDITLLFCSAFEQCGLNPLVVFTQGHVFAGVWLKPEEFTTVVIDDVTALRKRVKLKELVLFETTLATQRPCPGFKRAVEMGATHIEEDSDKRFELAIDIRRARLQRIKPLSSETVEQYTGSTSDARDEGTIVFDEAPDLPEEEIVRMEAPQIPKIQDRLDRWQRKLLDLSLRNSLLNFRARKRSIRIEAPDPGLLEDKLADGNTLKLLPQPDLMHGSDLRSRDIYESREHQNIYRVHSLDALNRNEVMVKLPKGRLGE